MSEPIVRTLDESEHHDAVDLLAHLNPDCPCDILLARFREIIATHPHYLPVGVFIGTKLVAFAAAWIATKIWCGRFLEIDNLVVHPDHRSSGLGSLLISHLESIASDQQCNILVLDSYTSNKSSHKLYHRLGYEIWGFHFVKPIHSIHR